jgi:hypothetical protein
MLLPKMARSHAGFPGITRHHRASISSALLLACNLIASRAAADPAACSAAYESGQRLLTTARLLDAASQFRYCGSPACPAIMHAECLRFLDRVEAASPSIVVRLRPEASVPVRVVLDGESDVMLDGHAITLDPGHHELRFSASGYALRQERFLVAEGEKLKLLEVRLEPLPEPKPSAGDSEAASAAAAPQPRTASVVPWVITAAIASAGAAGFVHWGLRGRSGETALERCSPNCSGSQVADVKRDYLLSNVSLAVGIGGLVAMGVWYVVRPNGTTRRATTVPVVTMTAGDTVSVAASF